MKKLLTFLLLLSFAATAQQVEFNEADASTLRQIIVSMNGQNALSKQQLKQLEKVNDVIVAKGKIPMNQIDDDVLLKFAERFSYDYQENERTAEGAAKFIWIMKRLYKADSTILDKQDMMYMIQDKNKLKDAIK